MSMLNFPLMQGVKLWVVYRICPQSCREQQPHSQGLFPGLGMEQEKVFPTPGKSPWEQGWENKDTGDSKHNDSPVAQWTGYLPGVREVMGSIPV